MGNARAASVWSSSIEARYLRTMAFNKVDQAVLEALRGCLDPRRVNGERRP